MKIENGFRYLLFAGLVIVVLVAWRLLSPYSIPMLADAINVDVREAWARPYFTIGQVAVTPVVLIKAFLFFALLVVFARTGASAIRRGVLDRTTLDDGQKFAAQKVLSYVVFALGMIIGLQSIGLDLSSLTVFSGALGIGVGLGMQTIAKNFVSGLILLLERPVKVGDRVQVETLQGDVVHIGARGTWVRTNDNVVIIVPNSEFIENRVTNWTANDRQVRVAVPLGVSYGSDPHKVREVLMDLAHRHPDVLEVPRSDVIFIGFGESSLDFELRIWTAKQVQTPKVIASDLYYEIFKAFRKEGIEIPFPQRDLHVKSVDLPIPVSNVQQSVPN